MESMKRWIMSHPNLTAWFVLALGMVILLVIEARDVGLVGSQWFWLIFITILVAGAAIWIISWGDDEETDLLEEDNQTETR
jgi:protein-S-isoprenylcysteine O-methyltransferase Ste14